MTQPNPTNPTNQNGQAPTNSAPAPDSPEYVAQMAAAYEGQGITPPDLGGQQQAPVAPKPDEAAPKTDGGEPKPDEAAPKTDGGEPKPDEPQGPSNLGEFLADESLGRALYETGKLTDDQLSTLEKFGIPKDFAQEVASAFKAQAEYQLSLIRDYAGGQEKLDALIAWGQKNLPADEREAIDLQLNGGSYKLAIDVLRARQAQAGAGPEPSLFQGNAQGGTVLAYQSQAEMVRDMQDQRYQSDPAFRRQVHERLRVSSF